MCSSCIKWKLIWSTVTFIDKFHTWFDLKWCVIRWNPSVTHLGYLSHMWKKDIGTLSMEPAHILTNVINWCAFLKPRSDLISTTYTCSLVCMVLLPSSLDITHLTFTCWVLTAISRVIYTSFILFNECTCTRPLAWESLLLIKIKITFLSQFEFESICCH